MHAHRVRLTPSFYIEWIHEYHFASLLVSHLISWHQIQFKVHVFTGARKCLCGHKQVKLNSLKSQFGVWRFFFFAWFYLPKFFEYAINMPKWKVHTRWIR